MSRQIVIPQFGESITSALIAQWHKAEGDQVQKGETLVSLETDKVSNDLEAEFSGTLTISVAEGEEVEIGAVIGEIAQGEGSADPAPAAEEKKAALTPAADPASDSSSGEKVDIVVPAVGESITSATVADWLVEDGSTVKKGQALVTLDTDKVSNEVEAEVDGVLTIATPAGEEVEIGAVLGHITKGAAAAAPASTPAPTPDAPAKPAPAKKAAPQPSTAPSKAQTQASAAPSDESRITRKKMTPMRRKIADHLVNAQHTAAILTTFNEVDMSAIMKLRKSVQEDFIAKHGVKLGFMSFFTKAVVQALKDVPAVNGRIDGTDHIQNNFYDVSIAIGTEKGLITPVLRDVDQKSFAEIEKDIIGYAMKAKEGKIQLSDLQGGVFTISNGGTYGSLLSTPILNPPQSGILGMHTIQQRPVAIDGKVEIRPMMYLALSYDHRLVDGKEAVTFLIRIKQSLENPTRMMLEM